MDISVPLIDCKNLAYPELFVVAGDGEEIAFVARKDDVVDWGGWRWLRGV